MCLVCTEDNNSSSLSLENNVGAHGKSPTSLKSSGFGTQLFALKAASVYLAVKSFPPVGRSVTKRRKKKF